MPVEVRELVIKAIIVQDIQSAGDTAQGGQNNGVAPAEEIIKVCVERVMEILKEKNER